MQGSWGVVIPVKRLAFAKTRLASYGDAVRQALALAFAADVVVMALRCPCVADVLVVTDDVVAGPFLADLGARVVADDPDAGLNPALEHGATLLRTGDAVRGVACLSADLPAATPAQLAAVLSCVASGQRAFVADAAGSGTTLLAAGPGAALLPAYGQNSRTGHLQQGAIELPAGEGLRRDVDTPTDLVLALALGVGRYTAEAAAGLR